MIIGLVGPSGTKKTSVAKHLEEAHGFARIHAGAGVKRAARAFGLTKAQTRDKGAKDQPTMQLGGKPPRALMEAIGTAVEDAVPGAIPEMLHRRVAKRMAKGMSVVVDGVRSPRQAKVLKDMGGVMVRTDNGVSIDPSKTMDQRAAAIKTDYTLDTSGKKADRKAAADRMLTDLRSGN